VQRRKEGRDLKGKRRVREDLNGGDYGRLGHQKEVSQYRHGLKNRSIHAIKLRGGRNLQGDHAAGRWKRGGWSNVMARVGQDNGGYRRRSREMPQF